MFQKTIVRGLFAATLAAAMAIGTAKGDIAPLTPGDVLVSNGTSLVEYNPSGGKIRTITVPPSPGASSISLRDIVVSPDGNLQVLDNGSTQCYLSTYNFSTQTWSQNTLSGWSLQGVTYYGGISADSNYVYVPDLTYGLDTTHGIIRFPLDNLSAPERFATSYSPHAVKVGLDGLVYAFERSGLGNLHVFDPNTLTHLRDVSVYKGASIESVAVASNGDIYTLDIGNAVKHLDPNGNLIASATDTSIIATDMELGRDGQIWLGSSGNKVTLTDTSLSSFSTFTTPLGPGAFNNNFVAFTTAQSVPEPATLTLLGSALLALGVVHLRQRGAKHRTHRLAD